MSLFYVLIAVLPIAALTALFAYSFNRKSKGVSGKKVLARNLIAFAVIAITVCAVTFSVSAANEDKTSEAEQPLRAKKQQQQHPIPITARVSDFLQPLSLQVFPASAAVSPLQQVLRQLSQQQVRMPRHSVKLLSSLPSVNQSPFTALLFQSLSLTRSKVRLCVFI